MSRHQNPNESALLRFVKCRARFLLPTFMKFDQLETRQRAVRPLREYHPIAKLPPSATPLRISVVIPSFNQAQYLEDSLQSVLNQSYASLELVVVDGGSTDGSPEIIQRYGDRLTWWCSESDGGQTQALNKGFTHTSGDIIGWLNSDDLLLAGTLERVASYFRKHPDVDLVYGHRVLIDDRRREIGHWILPPHNERILKWIDLVPQETMFWRRTLWERTGASLDESFSFAMDWEILLRFCAAGAKIVRLPYFVGAFRIHPYQKTSSAVHDLGYREMQRLRAAYLGFAPTGRQIALHTILHAVRIRMMELMWKAGILRYE